MEKILTAYTGFILSVKKMEKNGNQSFLHTFFPLKDFNELRMFY